MQKGSLNKTEPNSIVLHAEANANALPGVLQWGSTPKPTALAEPPNTSLSCSPAATVFYAVPEHCIGLSWEKDQILFLQLWSPGWDVHKACPSAQSYEHCLTTKTFGCHRENAANSHTVFIQHLSLFLKKEDLVTDFNKWRLLWPLLQPFTTLPWPQRYVGSLGVHSYLLQIFSCLLCEKMCCLFLSKLLHSAVSQLLHLQNEDNKNLLS